MANITSFVDVIDYTITGQSSEDSNWPSSNLKFYTKQFRYWKTTSTGDSWVSLNLGGATQVNMVILFNTNFASFNLQGNAADVWTSPTYNQTSITIHEDITRERYILAINPQDFATFNLQYMRIFIPTQATTDGDTGFTLGSLVVTDQAESLILNPEQGLARTPIRSTATKELVSGGMEKALRGNRLWQLDFDLKIDTSDTSQFNQAIRLFYQIDESTPLYVVPTGGAFKEHTNTSEFGFVTERVGSPSYRFDDWGTSTISGISLRETA